MPDPMTDPMTGDLSENVNAAPAGPGEVLHDDDPNATLTLPDGRVVRNLTAEEYEASYADGGPCNQIPDEVMEAAERAAAGWRAQAEKTWIEHPEAQLSVAEADTALERAPATVVLPWHPSPFFTSGRRSFQALAMHSVESNIIAGIAVSLADGWFAHDANTSAHKIFDPATRAQMVHMGDTAWALGNANSITGSYEHAGRAAYTRAQWTTPGGLAMLRESARSAADDAAIHGLPVRWLSVVQLARGEKGFCTHNDCRLAFGGTTHTDPGPGFPYDLYLSYVLEFTNPTPPTPPKEWWQMPIPDPELRRIAVTVRGELNPKVTELKAAIQTAIDQLAVTMGEEVDGAGFWLADLVLTGELNEHSRWAQGKFKSDATLAAIVAAFQGNGLAQLGARNADLEARVGELVTAVQALQAAGQPPS